MKRIIMKKIIGIIFISLMFANIGFAEIKLIEGDRISVLSRKIAVTRTCVDGYEYVTFSDLLDYTEEVSSGSITQSFEIIDGKSLPKKC